ncbi:hypothetical protein UFOVP236_50 [uncultured Caudovirales phage]|uniref:Uncharacterized protein n=1 Tax=uncultured Caudovirales phage TaxID=2100421 RepID=A0A6J7WUP2_9CAUD|nr:hypothetical protein UFOVP236_50 [uncultured Caudovirales phage]
MQILKKADQPLLNALAALESDPNFKVVLDWLAGSLDELHKHGMSTKDEVLTRWQQGACQAVSDIVDTTQNSRAALSRLK